MLKEGFLIGSSLAIATSGFGSVLSIDDKINNAVFKEGTGGGGSNDVPDDSGGTAFSTFVGGPGGQNFSGTISITCAEVHTEQVFCEYQVLRLRANSQIRAAGATSFQACASGSAVIATLSNVNCGGGGCGGLAANCMAVFLTCKNQETGIAFYNSTSVLTTFPCTP